MYGGVQTHAQFDADIPPSVALLHELHEVISLAGALEEVFLQWPADNIQQHGMLGVDIKGLVGLIAEKV